MEKTAVTVKIFNDEYTLKTDLPRTDVDAIAAMVDKKMQKLATSQHLVWRESYIPYVVNMKPC